MSFLSRRLLPWLCVLHCITSFGVSDTITHVLQTSPIVGGTTVSASYPWFAKVVRKLDGKWYGCGATLIAPRWAVSAAHCLITPSTAQLVFNGSITSHDVAAGEIVTSILRVLQHPDFLDDGEHQYNDIALLELSSDVLLPAADLHVSPLYLQEGVPVRIVGWGTLGTYAALSTTLRYADTQIIATKRVCEWAPTLHDSCTNNTLTHSIVFAGEWTTGSKDTCQGDSGGPLVYARSDNDVTLLGVTSYGQECGLPHSGPAYSSMAFFFLFSFFSLPFSLLVLLLRFSFACFMCYAFALFFWFFRVCSVFLFFILLFRFPFSVVSSLMVLLLLFCSFARGFGRWVWFGGWIGGWVIL